MKSDIKAPAPVRVRLSGILSGFSFSGIVSSSIMSSDILSTIRFGLHRGNLRATTTISDIYAIPIAFYCQADN